MKKIFLFASLAISITVFSQSEYNYKAKFEGANDATKAAPIIKSLKMVFNTPATFNESSGVVEFKSKMSISQTVFNNMMSGEGYQVESFERQEIKNETASAPVEVKKVAVDTTSKNKTITAKKGGPPKTGK